MLKKDMKTRVMKCEKKKINCVKCMAYVVRGIYIH